MDRSPSRAAARAAAAAAVVSSLVALALAGCSEAGGRRGPALASGAIVSGSAALGSSPASGAPGSAAPGATAPVPAPPPLFLAGAAAVDVTPPVGVPLGGFNEGARRRSTPDLNPFDYHTLFNPSTGILDPIWAKALVIQTGTEKVAIVTIDAIATTSRAVEEFHRKAAAQGMAIDLDHILVCASHTHSGPGTLSDLAFWELVAMDLYQPRVFDDFTTGIARALVEADRALAPARFGAASATLLGISRNRRSGTSPILTRDMVDPELGVLRIDRPDGTPVATVWNYAVHGLAFWSDNMQYSADLMGRANGFIERRLGGVALFANGAEGDLNPRGRGAADADALGDTIATAVLAARAGASTTGAVDLRNASEEVDFGPAMLDVSVSRIGTSYPLPGGQIWSFLRSLGVNPGLAIPIPNGWIETRFRFQAIRLNDTAIASIPGEAIHEIGLDIKRAGAALGFGRTFAFGLANGHMSYITNEREYDAGGYEGLATLFGRDTGANVVASALRQLQRVR